MRITTKVCLLWDEEAQRYVADPSTWEGYEYEGPIEHCGGGPSKEEKAAAASQASLTNELARVAGQNENYTEAQRNKTTPFYTNLMNEGPDYTNQALDSSSGTIARAFAPARARLIRSIGPANGLPGYRDQALTDFDENRANAYDQQLMSVLADRQAARERGAAGIMGEAQQANPLGYYSGAMQGNQSILGANLRKPGMSGIVGGILGAGTQAFV
jgi:hypothetical protein